MTLTLEGIHANRLHVSDALKDFDIEMATAKMRNLQMVYGFHDWHATFHDLQGTGLTSNFPLGKFNVDRFEVPEIRLAQEFRKDTPELTPHYFSVTIPELHSGGDLTVTNQETETELVLSGASTLKDLRAFAEFQGDKMIIESSVGLSGVIEAANIKNPRFGEVRFSTLENGGGKHPISGRLATTLVTMKNKQEEAPPPMFDMDLNLPYVGFASSGFVNIPSGSSTLRGAHFKINAAPELTGTLEGTVALRDASYDGTKEEPLKLGRIFFLPKLSGISASGTFKFEILKDSLRLHPAEGAREPLDLEFTVDGSHLLHLPDLSGHYLGKMPESQVIRSDIQMDSAKIRLAGVDMLEVTNVPEGDKIKKEVTRITGGPLTIHHVRGNATLWMPLGPFFGYKRGLFPHLGGDRPPNIYPDLAPLTEHLPAEQRDALRQLVGKEDFFHLGRIDYSRNKEDWSTHLQDLLVNIHEVGGRKQFVMMRLPEFKVVSEKDHTKTSGLTGLLLNLFLFDPTIGGFRVNNWPHRRPSKK